MKIIFACFLLIISQNIFAQIPYTDFIQTDTAIQWAAEYDQILNITPKIRRLGIRNILNRKMINGGCINNYSTNEDGAFKTSFCLKDTVAAKENISNGINPYYYFVKNDELKGKGFAWSEMPCSYELNIKRNKFHIYNVKQIITYSKATMSVQNILVSPLFLKMKNEPNMSNSFNWYSYYSSCFNNTKSKLSKSEKQKCIDLGNKDEKYDFHYALFDSNSKAKIFTSFDPILSKHIYEDILAKKITAVDLFNNYIPAEKIFEVQNPEIEVNEYDKEGKVIKILKLRNQINMDSIYNFSISQHFYFDSVNNILHSEINYVDVNKRAITSEGVDFGIGFYFRVYFIKPSLYKKRPQKRYLN